MDAVAAFDCLNPTTLNVVWQSRIGVRVTGSTKPWSMPSVAVPDNRTPVVTPWDDTLLIVVLIFPFAEAVTVISSVSPVTGLIRWTVKSKVAVRMPVSLAVLGSAVP